MNLLQLPTLFKNACKKRGISEKRAAKHISIPKKQLRNFEAAKVRTRLRQIFVE